jgi:hypothetical protein
MANLASALAALSALLAQEEDDEASSTEHLPHKTQEGPSVSTTRFQEETLTRMQQYQSKVDQRLEFMRQTALENELKEVKGRPKINSKSKQIKQAPLYLRVSQVLNEKNHHMTSLRTEAQSLKMAEFEECTFTPNMTTRSTRTSEQFCQQSQGWAEMKRQRLEKQAFERAQIETKELKFRPSISKASSRIASRKARGDVVERLTRSKTPEVGSKENVKQGIRSVTPTKAQTKAPSRMNCTGETVLDLSSIESSFVTVAYKPDLDFLLKNLI